jgi:hypothetical protein
MADQKTTVKPTGKTTGKTTPTGSTPTPTRVVPPTAEVKVEKPKPDVVVAPNPPSTPTPAPAPVPRVIEYGPRLNVTLNVATVANAFHNALASRSVRYVQYALHERGFEPGNDRGRVDFDTRKAYAEFQRSIDEKPTGVPTDHSLNVLGFDVS